MSGFPEIDRQVISTPAGDYVVWTYDEDDVAARIAQANTVGAGLVGLI